MPVRKAARGDIWVPLSLLRSALPGRFGFEGPQRGRYVVAAVVYPVGLLCTPPLPPPAPLLTTSLLPSDLAPPAPLQDAACPCLRQTATARTAARRERRGTAVPVSCCSQVTWPQHAADYSACNQSGG